MAQEKRQRRFRVCPRSGRVRSGARQWYLAEMAENKENEAFEKCEIGDRDEEVLNAKPSGRDITLECFVINRCAKVATKKRKQNTNDESYMRWLHSPSYMEFMDLSKSTPKYVHNFADEERERWDRKAVSWKCEVLPHLDIPLLENTTVEDFAARNTDQCRKVKGIWPEIYISESVTSQQLLSLAAQHDAYFIFRKVRSANGSDKNCVR
ncbi:unnamed protein product [Gongylonema pulchrum]|uniref:Uncharacterized protein n=1 Tax=Gongylonema pulchrum TaxID=637853 RepID=A0A3P7NKR9_9BILA|nr:unnamed protein product [Gongylonema pulchrum]